MMSSLQRLRRTNVYIGGLPVDVTDLDLHDMCDRLYAKFTTVSFRIFDL